MLCIAALGIMFGIIVQNLLVNHVKLTQVNITICMILFILFVEFLWLPFAINVTICMKYDKEGLSYLPSFGHFKTLKIIFQILLGAQIEDYYELIYWTDIHHIRFTFERRWGAWGYSRYTLQLYFIMKNKDIKLFLINPMDNGPALPSSAGGIPLLSGVRNEDTINTLQFIKTCGVTIEDPHQLQEALKNPDIILYDYLETINKPFKY